MNNLRLSNLLSLLLVFLNISIARGASTYTPTESIALNCGGESGRQDGRTWTADAASESILSQHENSSSTSKAATQDYAPQIPYMTARIFRSKFTYAFPVTAGTKFIRLHFHPASYSGLNASNFFFSVTVNDRHSLLQNFSASLFARSLNEYYFFKEFCVNMASESILNLTFSPSPASFAFVNGIEIVSMPTNLYITGQSVSIVGQLQELPVDNNTALEMVYRLNVDGLPIAPESDVGMFRAWSGDSEFIFGSDGVAPYHLGIDITYSKVPFYTAPDTLYRTARSMGTSKRVNENYNLTWLFPVDTGFYYLVRLHFCEIDEGITGINQRVFEIFLNNQTAESEMDIMVSAGAIGVPIYKEFIVMVPQGAGGKQDLWLALHPNTRVRPKFYDALLNGLEIFKLNKSDGTLAGPNPEPGPEQDQVQHEHVHDSSKRHDMFRTLLMIAAALVGGAIVTFILWYWIFRRGRVKLGKSLSWRGPFSSSTSEMTDTKFLPSDMCRHFSLAQIKTATNNFDDALVIGVGGFGNVYKGNIDGGTTAVAIKRLNPSSQQGAHEFRTEIEMLSQLRHLHLVSLIGYCHDHDEMILVYDYMAHGTLRDHLYNTTNPPIPWSQRLKICIGAARGLHYLHSGAKHPIIHRDVKTTNILLDEKWVAKVSDFGLSKVGPTDVSCTHVSTMVKGSFGYLDPEYYRRQQLTTKSDVYSFGVVLFEVLCARAPLNKNLDKSDVCLAEWARSHCKTGELGLIVDPYLSDKIAPECLRKFGEVAYACLLDQRIERPSMADVVWNLEFALQLQESAEVSGTWIGRDGGDESPFCKYFASGCTNSSDVMSGSTGDSALGLSGSVFSEIISPQGR